METDINQRESFVFHKDWYNVIEKRSDKVRLEVYDAIMGKVFQNKDISLSESSTIILDFIMPQIEKETSKWLEIKRKRKEVGSLGGRPKNQKNQKVLEKPKGLFDNQEVFEKTKQKHSVSVNVSVDNNNVILKEKEDKSSSKKDEDDFVEKIYKLYPSKCPVRKTTLGKCSKDKDRIRKLLGVYSESEIEQVVRKEIDEKYGKHYMQNFSTFLNNFPDPHVLLIETTTSENGQTNNPYPKDYWQ